MMLTDWLLIARLASEIEERLRGARVEDAGLLADGRVGIAFRNRGSRTILAIDVFSSPPMITFDEGELGIAAEPGFVRALGRSLRGMTLARSAARRNDRLIRLSFAARSSFGVGDAFDLYVELVPRYGNIVLVKGETVVGALKEFALSENAHRAIAAGLAYVAPPLPSRPGKLAELAAAGAVVEGGSPLYVYRRGGNLLQAYVAPLEGFGDAQESREWSIAALFTELRSQQMVSSDSRRVVARRQTLRKRLAARERKLRDELEHLANKRGRAQRRGALREEGEAIFSTLYELDGERRDAAKERAAEVFAEYKRLAKSVPHIDARERSVHAALEAIETLQWETERCSDEDLDAVERAVAELTRRGERPAPTPATKRKRPWLELRTPRGSRIVVGRSPIENADLTFRIARPNDLWFHAQGIPGAHVILARDDRTDAPDEDLETAASLAAYYSRAKLATSVAVDYTLRKHVRKQRAAPPGLVWYTHAKTIVAQPKPLDAAG
ncbi:MAG: DUF814 domain-containing protein [Candidatus Eremiobacteraeota bacterium]|nr:DUF814 domain-containing protein [Candidatus Eremiobacteraeota bacterium]